MSAVYDLIRDKEQEHFERIMQKRITEMEKQIIGLRRDLFVAMQTIERLIGENDD